ncbi:hypothetical protein ACFV2N_41345 [Streptomyces sp. NPDC059680]|uniref:hypothetical protein n=1 Tax=Streptomyces sp. NPDC059680 TaxID=3346904 RepID=UPI0036B6EFF2
MAATAGAGDALTGHAAGAPYDLMHSEVGVPGVPSAWVRQLAPGRRLLTTYSGAYAEPARATPRDPRPGRAEGSSPMGRPARAPAAA